MTIRSMKWAAGVSLFAAMLAVGTTLPERQARLWLAGRLRERGYLPPDPAPHHE